MKKKSTMLIFSFTLSTFFVVGAWGFLPTSKANANNGGMMNMMEAMNSAEGQKMMESCSELMSSYEVEDQETDL